MEIPDNVLSCDGFQAWITVDGSPCTQYGVQYEKGDVMSSPKASCWIASTVDKSFSINVRKEKDDDDYQAMVYLDEHLVVNPAYYKTETTTRTISTAWVSDYETKNFQFAPLELTDDDSYLENLSQQNIGNIRVVVRRGKIGDVTSSREYDVVASGKVHERSKKGLSHRVKYGPVQQSASKRRTVKFIPHNNQVTFLFKYRPLGILQASEIAPRTQPQPENTENDVINQEETLVLDSDDEKEKELLAQLESVRNRKRAKQNDERPNKKVKTEPVRHFIPGEIIDLTL